MTIGKLVYAYKKRVYQIWFLMELSKKILDSFKNIIYYLKDACSVGGYVLSSECLIANKKIYVPASLKSYKKEQMWN